MAVALLTPDGTKIAVVTEYREMNLIKLAPGARRNSVQGWWEMPKSWGSCITLRGIFGDALVVDESLRLWSQAEYDNRIAPSLALRGATEYDEGDPRLRGYQKAGVKWILTSGSVLLGDDMGSGKTVQVCTALDALGEAALPAVVICPNSMKPDWVRHLDQWTSLAVPYLIDGTPVKKRKALEEAAQDPHAVVVVNIESLRTFTRLAPYGGVSLKKCRECDPISGEEGLKTSLCEKHPKELNAIPFRTVVFDEAHRMQDCHAKQTRAAWALMHQEGVTTRWALTGTPGGDNIEKLWPILHGIAREDWPTKSKAMDRYALMSYNPFGGMEVVGINPATRDEFFKILDTRFRRMPKDLILRDLPAKVRTQRFVTMTPKQRKAYAEISDRMMTRLEDGTLLVTPDNLSAHIRLIQLSSSYAEIIKEYEDDPTTWKVVLKDPSPKIDELVEILQDVGPDRQVAACAQSRQLIDLACARLEKEKISFSYITGAINPAERDYQLRQFQEGKTRVMLFTIAAGGTGLTMTAADTIVFMQRSWRMIDNLQAENRVHRIGSERHESIQIIDIVTEGTIEQTHQLPALLLKMERLEEIIRDRETLRAAGISTDDLDREESMINNSIV
jgi:SNF2 family DNA or RNA helicase